MASAKPLKRYIPELVVEDKYSTTQVHFDKNLITQKEVRLIQNYVEKIVPAPKTGLNHINIRIFKFPSVSDVYMIISNDIDRDGSGPVKGIGFYLFIRNGTGLKKIFQSDGVEDANIYFPFFFYDETKVLVVIEIGDEEGLWGFKLYSFDSVARDVRNLGELNIGFHDETKINPFGEFELSNPFLEKVLVNSDKGSVEILFSRDIYLINKKEYFNDPPFTRIKSGKNPVKFVLKKGKFRLIKQNK